MQKSGKLELTWVGKYEKKTIEPRILVENYALSYGDPNNSNMLVHGDNLIALKALQQEYAEKVKCVFIDPPYNTGSAFEQYDDAVEHSLWLSLMSERLWQLRNLLAEDGSIWITIDDSECHYLKVLCDEVFGRKNFLGDIAWEKVDSPKMDSRFFSSRYDHVLCYAKNLSKVCFHRIPQNEDTQKQYNKRDENGRLYYLKPLRAMNVDGTREARPALYYPIIAPDGSEVYPINPNGTDGRWRWGRDRVEREKDRIEWIRGKKGWSANYRIYKEENAVMPPETIWTHGECGSNRLSKQEVKDFVQDGLKAFDTPKPEKLIARVLQIATDPGDIVLDSFLGSGTTIAVAHKMMRRWIGIEMENTVYSHCKVRIDKVINGEQGGISKSVNWTGGGGYKFYELAPSLLVKNPRLPIYQINPEYTFEMMCEAICKIEGFKYAPDGVYHGHSSEKRFIYVTKEFVNAEYIQSITTTLGEDQSLLIYGIKIQSDMILPDNIEVKRIPKDLLEKCDFESEVR